MTATIGARTQHPPHTYIVVGLVEVFLSECLRWASVHIITKPKSKCADARVGIHMRVGA